MVDAALHGELKKVRRLVQKNRALLDSNDGLGTPLTAATHKGHLELLRYLLTEGAQPG
jgi:ankyrin repeat protein